MADAWDRWNETQQDDYMSDNRLAYMSRYQAEREEALELICWYAERGRVKSAWADCRREIQVLFENRPCDGAIYNRLVEPWREWEGSRDEWDAYRAQQIDLRQVAHAEWLVELRELLALRRSIPKIAADAACRMTASERDRMSRFNQFISEAA